METFQKPLGSIWQLFSAFSPIFSSSIIREHNCKTKVETHIAQWGGHTIYIGDAFAID